AFSQSGEDLFQKALRLERNEGKLVEAIEIYTQVVTEGKNESLAAQAQLRIGLCYEKLGQKRTKQAQDAFQKVINNFPGQTEAVKIAQEKLSNLLSAKKVIDKGNKEFSIRKVMSLSIPGDASPDGRLISYVDWGTGNGELAIMEIATGKKRRLTHKDSEDDSWHFVIYSIFSANGKKLVFTRWKNDDTTDFRIINVDGSEQRVLLNEEEVYAFLPNDWTPNGKYILGVLQKNDKTNNIAYVSAIDGNFRIIKDFDKRSPGKLSLSSDGRWIAYDFPQDEKSDKRNIFLLSEDGSREIPLLKHPADDRLLGWAPSGDWILFSSDRSGSWDAWIVPVSDGKPEGDPILVKRDFGQVKGLGLEPMGFTQDGSFYFGDRVWLEDIYVAEIDTEKTKILRPPKKIAQRFEGSNCDPVWSPDGQYLAYLSRREPEGLKSRAICIMNMNSGEEIELFPEFKSLYGLRWFPDVKSFLVSGTDENDQTGLFRVDARTGEIALIVTGDSGYHALRCSPDGKKAFYEADLWREKIFRILMFDLDSQQKKEVYRSESQIIRMDISPDGKQVVFYEGKDDALKLISVDGGQPEVLLKLEEGSVNSVAWSPDGKDIFFSKIIKGGKTGKCELWRIPSEGGEPEKFDLTADGLIDLNIHPEGSRIAFTLWHVDEEVWVMENFLPKSESKK
ncbi:MAG: tetratricopeptide repeat protein, partial [Candidatus Aminicenantes bacterium]|nr:tetratricopeptide repeat protein [Candidatus Aminicenantes bacterium]